MKTLIASCAAAALTLAAAAPALAQVDAGTLTCGAFYALDSAGQAEAQNAIMNFVKDTANAATVGTAAQTMADMSDAEARAQIDKSCEGQTVDTNLISVLK
jgi:hypothetical protein